MNCTILLNATLPFSFWTSSSIAFPCLLEVWWEPMISFDQWTRKESDTSHIESMSCFPAFSFPSGKWLIVFRIEAASLARDSETPVISFIATFPVKGMWNEQEIHRNKTLKIWGPFVTQYDWSFLADKAGIIFPFLKLFPVLMEDE